MDSRELLVEIPKDRFHSAIFTTFSINLYYLEQQVLPLLNDKGIGYVSILADANMLSGVLESYGIMSESRKRSYSLHGVHSDGAFHSKIIFLVGEEHILVLLGSGNLTTAGHGRNLESWNVIQIDSEHHRDAPLIASVWQYIHRLHSNLGQSAMNKLKTVSENCRLLQQNLITEQEITWDGNDAIVIFDDKNNSILNRLKDLIPSNNVETITIFSPYYDSKGRLIILLNEYFKPKRINVILQEKFGCFPKHMPVASNFFFYNWEDWQYKGSKQRYSHAKKILFETTDGNFLFTGSANASIAAMGDGSFSGHNREACLLYRIGDFELLEKLGIDPLETVDMHDLHEPSSTSKEKDGQREQNKTIINALEFSSGELKGYFYSEEALGRLKLCLYGPTRNLIATEELVLPKGTSSSTIPIPNENYLYGELRINDQRCSNLQFIINLDRFDATNPSPENREFLRIKYMVEAGNFVDGKILDYLTTISQKEPSEAIQYIEHSDTKREKHDDSSFNEEKIELSYEQIRDRDLLASVKLQHELETYRVSELWDTILGYIRDGFQRSLDEKIDEEETEDVNKSTGRKDKVEQKLKVAKLSLSKLSSIRKKVSKHLQVYLNTLYNHAEKGKPKTPDLIDLSIFLIVLQMLLHFKHRKFHVLETDVQEPLFRLAYSDHELTWSSFVVSIIGAFNLWASRSFLSDKLKNEESKFSRYAENAYQLIIAVMAIYGEENSSRDEIKTRRFQCLAVLNAKRNLLSEDQYQKLTMEEALSMLPQELINDENADLINIEINNCRNINQENLSEEEYFEHMFDGWCYILKKVQHKNDLKKFFLKFSSIGYHYETAYRDYASAKMIDLNDYKLYSIK